MLVRFGTGFGLGFLLYVCHVCGCLYVVIAKIELNGGTRGLDLNTKRWSVPEICVVPRGPLLAMNSTRRRTRS